MPKEIFDHPRNPKASKKPSYAWKEFGHYKLDDGSLDMSHCVCRHCFTKLKFNHNTTNMRDHLSAKHSITERSAQPSQPTMAKMLSTPAKPISNEELTNGLVQMIAEDGHPMNVVEGSGFRKWIFQLAPTYVVPARSTISRRIKTRYEIERAETKALIAEQPPGNVHITNDHWGSADAQNFSIITGHYMNDNMEVNTNHFTNVFTNFCQCFHKC